MEKEIKNLRDKRMKKKGLSALEIAKWFINHVDREAGDNVTHLKLQKLLYYAQAWYLANYNEPLFKEELQAWTHGPVVPSVWLQFKHYEFDPLPIQNIPTHFDNEIEAYLRTIYKEYGKFSAKELERLTHQEDPWNRTRGNIALEERCTTPIDQELMKDYYKAQIKH